MRSRKGELVNPPVINRKRTAPAPSKSPEGKRINLVLADSAYSGAMELSRETRRTLSEIVRYGLALVRIAVEEGRNGNKLVVTKPTGEPIKEIMMPL
jgi:hypothetical protein